MVEAQRLPWWIDSSGKAVGLIAAASLGASIVYDWGFYYALDLSFSELPTSLADHIRSSLVWVPLAAFTAFLVTVYELLTRRIEGGMTEKEIIESSPDPERTRRMRARPYKFMTTFAVIVLASYILFGESFSRGVPLALILVWFSFCAWANRHPGKMGDVHAIMTFGSVKCMPRRTRIDAIALPHVIGIGIAFLECA